jgi:hypothetical protein
MRAISRSTLRPRPNCAYKGHLAACDQTRRNDLDGRGNLSEESLAECVVCRCQRGRFASQAFTRAWSHPRGGTF